MNQQAVEVLTTRYDLLTYPRAQELESLIPYIVDVLENKPDAVQLLAARIEEIGEKVE